MLEHGRKISVVGLGYVGLPVAVSFAKTGKVIAFDINRRRIAQLKKRQDITGEVNEQDLKSNQISFTSEPEELSQADFHIVTVPTPITKSRQPDLRPLLSASTTVGRNLKKGDIVVFESTVYPGATEEECVPVLEAESGLQYGRDFTVGYSPERINPGDKEHRFETITKVVSGSDQKTLDTVASVYGAVVKAGVHKASEIKVAEAAKVIENTQRDLNIALMNELALIFDRLGVRSSEVLEAANTKWNFLPFTPGLVGGHCIGVDPYYLTAKAESIGYYPQVILAGRRINDGMGEFIANKLIKFLAASLDKPVQQAKVGVLGLTFKENVPDLRNSRVPDIINEVNQFGLQLQIHDPLADDNLAQEEYGLTLSAFEDLKALDALILAVPHQKYLDQIRKELPILLKQNGILLDIKSALKPGEIPQGITYWSL